MKKILAMILALLMIATMVSLSACGDDDENPDNDDNEYEYPADSKDTADDSDEDEDTDDEDEDTEKREELEETDWIKKSDNVCVGVTGVVLREGPGVDYDVVKSLKAGDKLKRTGTNGRWNKVTVDGDTYYVSASYTTSETDDFVFEEYEEDEQVLLNVKEECTINLRSTPFYSDSDAEANLLFSGFGPTETDEDGEALKLIAKSKSGNWYKVSFTGTWGSKTYENQICYLKNIKSVVDVVDGLSASSNGNDVVFG
ncbi:MAG: SH3 domain-containing protein [Clostridia bacterium]|nr:SH3 domain-containing protein [Clostridia bacterium]